MTDDLVGDGGALADDGESGEIHRDGETARDEGDDEDVVGVA